MQPVDIRDVARRAGVSVATVSNVFNRPDIVAVNTRNRVHEAVDELGYVRNESARQLRMGHSRTIGLIVPDIANPFFTDVARGVEDTARAAGSLVIVCNTDDDPDKERSYLTMLAEQQVQGALSVPVRGAHVAAPLLRKRGVPVVLLDSTDDASGGPDDVCSVAVHDVAGGRTAVAHLVETGHQRVGLVGAGYAAHQVVERSAGAAEAMAAAGRPDGALVPMPTRELTLAGGAEAARTFLAQSARRRPTGLFCVNDLVALGVLHELLRAGVRVPDDVAIVGYDDIGFAETAAIPLTTLRQPRQRLGERATELLLAEVGGQGHRHESVMFEPELIVRASSPVSPR